MSCNCRSAFFLHILTRKPSFHRETPRYYCEFWSMRCLRKICDVPDIWLSLLRQKVSLHKRSIDIRQTHLHCPSRFIVTCIGSDRVQSFHTQSHATPYPGSEMVWQDHQCHNKGDKWTNGSTLSHRRTTPFTFWSHLPIIKGYACITSPTRAYIYPLTPSLAHRRPLTGSSHRVVHASENLASTGGRRYGSTHQCLSIRIPGPLIMEIATTLSWSSSAVSEWGSGHDTLSVAARGSVAPGANVRPAAPSCPRFQPTRECGELPSVRMEWSPDRMNLMHFIRHTTPLVDGHREL